MFISFLNFKIKMAQLCGLSTESPADRESVVLL